MRRRVPGDEPESPFETPLDDVPSDERGYRRYVASKVRQGIEDLDAGRTISSEDLAREIESW